jgi:hypothetical protein
MTQHYTIAEKPHLSRRRFFSLAGSSVIASFLTGERLLAQSVPRVETFANVETKNTANNVVFILLAGAPSHTDTFDYKESPDSPGTLLKPERIGGVVWPTGVLPRLAEMTNEFAIVRSLRSWALVHNLAQTWTQIGRSPAGALGEIAPNIGSVIAIEKAAQRRSSDIFPTFLALNSAGGVGNGYLPSTTAPFRVTPASAGLANTRNPDDSNGSGRFAEKYSMLERLDNSLRRNSPLGNGPDDMEGFYQAARGLMYNNAVQQAFSYTAAERDRYGTTGFGDACLVAHKVLRADLGTRFIQITLGGWDHHDDIYAPTNLPARTADLDRGLSTLLEDLKSSGLLNQTLVLVAGEFGRTVGRLTPDGGRDHHMQQFAVLAGAGVKGGKVIGATDATGATTVESGWSRDRDIRPEDLEATIYSAMGVNWTTVRYDDPFGRGFYYVPESNQDVYGPVNELWT